MYDAGTHVFKQKDKTKIQVMDMPFLRSIISKMENRGMRK
jgi:hypothetical protein